MKTKERPKIIATEKSAIQNSDSSAWFDQSRFGMFIHWGIYSLLAHENGEWVLFKNQINRKEYNRLSDQFTARRFDADALAGLAKRAGMRYMVLTARHHDGFCLFNTKTTDFNSLKSASGRDFVAEYVAACRRAGLHVGIYYSIMSWQQEAIYNNPEHNPEKWEQMVQETHAQVRELMTNYGKIDMLWYDGGVVPGIQDSGIIARYWRSAELNAMVRQLQPDILINDRSGMPADFATPEQHVRAPKPGRRWEACMTMNRSWGYNIHDRDFKSAEEIIKSLIRCARYGGNLLLNIGPRADGTVQTEITDTLEEIGDWLERNGESIYSSERSLYTEADHIAGAVTQKEGRIYVHLAENPGGAVLIDGVGQVSEARILGCNHKLAVSATTGNAVKISGFSDEMFAAGTVVFTLSPSIAMESPARLLGGGDEPRVVTGNAPVLGDDPDRHAPPMVPVSSGPALAEHFCKASAYKIEKSENWCLGWRDWPVFSPVAGNRLEMKFDVSVSGQYDLSIGVIAKDGNSIRLAVDALQLGDNCIVHNPGCPDTLYFPALRLTSGSRSLSVESDGRLGLYAFRMEPVWHPIPSECWYTIGPFPTAFGPQKSICEVRKAMEETFPPEESFDLDACYSGAGGTSISWTHSENREGEHTGYGVNFPYRCGTQASGVCYARTVIVSPEDRKATIMLGCDWWANIWINGELVVTKRDPEECDDDGAYFSTWKPIPADVELKKGKNVFLVKCHPGTCANWFSFRISDPGDLEVVKK